MNPTRILIVEDEKIIAKGGSDLAGARISWANRVFDREWSRIGL